METITMYLKRMMTSGMGFVKRKTEETVYLRLVRYIEEARRDGVIGAGRYSVTMGKARKLQRFLMIKGLSKISAHEFVILFGSKLVMSESPFLLNKLNLKYKQPTFVVYLYFIILVSR